jgi:hypothetical protein
VKANDGTRWELERALAKSGCPICTLSREGVHHYLDGLLYENVNDPGIREHVTGALGFCNRHAWEMREMHGSSLGTALLHRDALKQWQRQLDAATDQNGRADLERSRARLAQANEPKRGCVACEQQDDIERRTLAVLLESLFDRGFVRALGASAGLCRRHFGQACHAARDAAALETLVAIQSEANRRLIGELDEFIRKNDYRFRDEGFGAEADSWIRAIGRLSGEKEAMC